MKKKLLILNIIFALLAPAFSLAHDDDTFWNEINEVEYPEASKVLPYGNIKTNDDGSIILESGVEKNISF